MMKRLLTTLAAVLSLSACDTSEEETAALSPIKLYVFDCGTLHFDDIAMFGLSNEESAVRDLSVPCYIVEHEKGRLLWDGGLPSEVAAAPDGVSVPGMVMRLERTFADQIGDMGLSMSSFDFVAFSHMHFDHVGVANEIEGAVLITQTKEMEAAFSDHYEVYAGAKQYYEKVDQLERIDLDGDMDVFGDGRVRVLSAPGHTPGHQVLYLDLEETGPIVLSGDLYHFVFSRLHRRTPHFNTNKEDTLTSMDRIEELLEREGATLWIEHNMEHFKTLKKAPEYYQ